ncbi:hypothetical protein M407DRAFT_155949 [Tulasnella calospora MUT 4182]|uniref:Amino acid permease/ SLC12A domain-containing protein n=1 Tax=Tulasnella calospora MUT 4182 TaxID=1051891 RepID=A0A0C3Q5B9_9AGAM|nr:hypothetical protein M407DRAFT_155949 [Tulasnella calospora MUT 4182]
MIAVNMMPVRVFGEIEFGFGLVKISLVIGLVILSLVLDLGLLPGTERLGFRYWRQDAFRELSYGSDGVIHGPFGRFLAVWSTLINAAFAFAHIQLIAIAGAETINPRRAIPKALSRTSIGVFALYVSVIFSIGLILPATHPGLRSSATSGSGSPFAIAAREAGIGFVGSIINAVVLTSAFSSGVTSIFVSSRSLVALADESNAPAILKRTHEGTGVPYVAVLAASSLGGLSYLSLYKTTAEALALLVGLSAVAGLVAWCVLCFTYLRMRWGMKVQGFTRDDLPYQAPLQPFIGWFAFIVCLLTLLFNGFAVFLPGNFKISDFLSSYSNVFLFVVLYYSWRRISNISTTSLGSIKLSGEFKAARGDSSGESPVVAGYELVPEAPA